MIIIELSVPKLLLDDSHFNFIVLSLSLEILYANLNINKLITNLAI